MASQERIVSNLSLPQRRIVVGDRVVAQTKIATANSNSIMLPGHTGTITQVYDSSKSQIVGVKPDDPKQLPMIDIVCMFNMPPVFKLIS